MAENNQKHYYLISVRKEDERDVYKATLCLADGDVTFEEDFLRKSGGWKTFHLFEFRITPGINPMNEVSAYIDSVNRERAPVVIGDLEKLLRGEK